MERHQNKHRPGLSRRPLGYPKGKQKNRTTNLTCSWQRVRVLLPHFSLPPSLLSAASLTWPQWPLEPRHLCVHTQTHPGTHTP